MKNSASSRKKPVKKAAKASKPTSAGQRLIASAKEASAKVRKQKTITNDETCLHKHCKQWLEKSGLWDQLLIFHIANERKGSIGAAMHFKRMGVRPGVADWLLFVPGRSVAIELKDDEGQMSKEQVRFAAQWTACGNPYFVARTLEEFQGIVLGVSLFTLSPSS